LPPHILICGYYGFGNAGDEAILTVLTERLRLRHADARFTVVAYPFADLRDIAVSHGVHALDARDVAAVAEAATEADLMVLGGGGLFQDYLPADHSQILGPAQANLAVWSGYGLLAAALGKPLLIWGVGVGPLTTDPGRRATGLVFGQAAAALVRDQASLRLLSDLGIEAAIELAADPAFLLEPPEPETVTELMVDDDVPTGGRLRIGVVVRPWEGAWQEPLAAALDRLINERDADVIFLPFQQSGRGLENDAHAATLVAARMRRVQRRAVIHTEYTPRRRMGILATCDVVIGMRLHSVVFAAAAGVPVVGLSYDPKVSHLMEELGLEDLTIDLRHVDAEQVFDRTSAALESTPDRRAAVAEKVELLRERARLSEEAAFRLLDRPESRPPTEEADRILRNLALRRSADATTLAAENHRLTGRLESLTADFDNLQEAYDTQATQYQELLDARAVRAIRSYWTWRQQTHDPAAAMRDLGVSAARKLLPGRARRALRWMAPRQRRGDKAPVLSPDELAGLRAEASEQLQGIIAAHPDAPGFVVYPPGIGWDIDLFQRPQQMALAFAHQGYPVIYTLTAEHRGDLLGFHNSQDGLYLCYLPEELMDILQQIPRAIYLSYVYNFDWRHHLTNPISVYEHIDHLEVFEHVHPRRDLEAWYSQAIRHADIVAASAADLLEEAQTDRSDTVLVPNGVDYRHFAGFEPGAGIPGGLEPILQRGAPIVGYYGAIAEWVDYDLIEFAARHLPEYSFVFIGPDYDGSMSQAPAFDLPNVFWLGPKPYGNLPGYLHHFNVATIPFVVNEVTHAVSPLKLFEYMAGAKPIVTPALRECTRYRAVLVAEDSQDYVAKLQEALQLQDDPEYLALLDHTARANTWDKRVGTIIDAVEMTRVRRRG
jgi:polysaccharide pyruvyl transferase CsaB